MQYDWNELRTRRFELGGEIFTVRKVNRFTVTFARGEAVTVTLDKGNAEKMLTTGEIIILEAVDAGN